MKKNLKLVLIVLFLLVGNKNKMNSMLDDKSAKEEALIQTKELETCLYGHIKTLELIQIQPTIRFREPDSIKLGKEILRDMEEYYYQVIEILDIQHSTALDDSATNLTRTDFENFLQNSQRTITKKFKNELKNLLSNFSAHQFTKLFKVFYFLIKKALECKINWQRVEKEGYPVNIPASNLGAWADDILLDGKEDPTKKAQQYLRAEYAELKDVLTKAWLAYSHSSQHE